MPRPLSQPELCPRRPKATVTAELPRLPRPSPAFTRRIAAGGGAWRSGGETVKSTSWGASRTRDGEQPRRSATPSSICSPYPRPSPPFAVLQLVAEGQARAGRAGGTLLARVRRGRQGQRSACASYSAIAPAHRRVRSDAARHSTTGEAMTTALAAEGALVDAWRSARLCTDYLWLAARRG